MSRREKWLLFGFIILALAFLFCIPLKIAYPAEKPVEGPQIEMKVIPGALGPWLAVEPQDVVVRLALVPLNPDEHYAPLAPGDNLLCHAYSPDGLHYGYRCGTMHYVVTKFDVFSKHKPKKEEKEKP